MRRLHLPDCNSLSADLGLHPCDCGKPPGILPMGHTLVRRYSKKRGKVGLVVISRSNLREGEEDLCVSALQFEVDADAFVRQQLRADDRKARRRAAKGGQDVWTMNG